uniref:VanZ like family protein n=2 Tax=unclassified Candidatus Kentrum TaxID=2643149 RepID=A0A451AQW1_9GAMM|nr:MAG: VanZ like family protein [Candidatus Kentron sp. LPFa]VFK68444.1 MAG: VanZ like family protein [Candidatus Kentron sp. UNK]VFK73545.1 MAG: VanZ like family protein [Candidatus Kentron sp. UNK]
MKELKYKNLWATLGYFYAALIFFICLKESPPGTETFPYQDKIFHFLAYFLLCFWFGQIYSSVTRNKIFIWSFLMGLLIELIQSQLSYRSAELADLLANTLGSLMGIFFGLILIPNVLSKIDGWLQIMFKKRS